MTKEKIISYCEKTINWLFIAVVFLTPIYFAYFAENYNIFELNKLLIVRVGVSLILFLFLIKTSLGAKVFIIDKKLIGLSLAVLFVCLFFGAIFSSKPNLSFWGNYDRQQGVYSLIYYWLFFILFILNIKTKEQTKNIIRAVLIASGLVSVYGIIQHFGFDPQRWLVDASRSFSSLGQPNFLGHYLVMVIPLAVAGFWLFNGRKKYYFLSVLLLLQLTCLLFSLSRAAWLGLILALACLMIIDFFINKRKRIIFFLIILMALIFVPAIFYNQFFPQNSSLYKYYGRLGVSFNLSSGSEKIRLLYWTSAVDGIVGRPWRQLLIGSGKDTQTDFFIKKYNSNWALYEALNSFPDRAHNIILDNLIEFGLVGLLVFSAFIFYLIGKALKYLQQQKQHKNKEYYIISCLLLSIFSYFFTACFGFPLTTHYLYYYLIVGLLVVWLLSKDGQEYDLNFLSQTFKWTITILIIGFVFFFLYFFTFKAYVADIYYMKAKKAEARVNCADIIYYSDKMLNAFPSSPRLKEQYAFLDINCVPFLNNKNDLIIIFNKIVEVFDSYPIKERGYHALVEEAHTYSMFGRYLNSDYFKQAEEYYLALIEINPEITFTYRDYALMKMWAGEYDKAKNIIMAGFLIMPRPDDSSSAYTHYAGVINQKAYFYEILGVLANKQKDYSKALSYFLLSQKNNPQNKLVYQEISDAYWELEEFDKAFDFLDKGREIDPGDSVWDYNKALRYLEQNKLGEALTSANLAIAISPEDEQIKKLIEDLSNKIKR